MRTLANLGQGECLGRDERDTVIRLYDNRDVFIVPTFAVSEWSDVRDLGDTGAVLVEQWWATANGYTNCVDSVGDTGYIGGVWSR